LGQVRKTVAIDKIEKVPLSVTIGAPYDMAQPDFMQPPDLRAAPDLFTGPTDAAPRDLTSD
jgi:hypothetical protein